MTISATPIPVATKRNSRVGRYSASTVFSRLLAARAALCLLVPAQAVGRPGPARVWCPRGDSNPHDLSRYHLKVVRLPIPPPGQFFLLCPYRGTEPRHCNRYQSPCGTSCPGSPCAGGDTAGGWVSGAEGTADSGAAGAAFDGAGTALSGAGATGTSDITPRSTATGPDWRASCVACQAMNRVRAKKVMASHLVDLLRKFEAPRAPKTVADAPPPKPEPACAPAPRCMRISAISEMATSTKAMLRMSCSMVPFSGALAVSGPLRPRWP